MASDVVKITTQRTKTGRFYVIEHDLGTKLCLAEGAAEKLAVDLLEKVRVNHLQDMVDRRIKDLVSKAEVGS